MENEKFNFYRVNSRKDLLHFIEENADDQVYKNIGENPRAWIDELNIINLMLTKNNLMGGIGLDRPPTNESDFRELGNGAFLYRGKFDKLKGLWIRKNHESLENITGKKLEWTHYKIGSRAILEINKEFSDISFEKFLPENFESRSNEAKRDKAPKRPVLIFPISHKGKEINIYAKRSDLSLSYYYDGCGPSFRLTNIAGINKLSSKREMEIMQEIETLGIKIPKIIGFYESDIDDFLFLEEVKGEYPNNYFETHRLEIIKQDAEMLALLCLAGYRKTGFNDFDDKIFDGKDLYLIDVDEFSDLYSLLNPDYKKILLNPQITSELNKFRENQKNIFESTLKDVIYKYRNSLTPTKETQKEYIIHFSNKIGLEELSNEKIDNLTYFSKDYMTLDSYLSMMSDTG